MFRRCAVTTSWLFFLALGAPIEAEESAPDVDEVLAKALEKARLNEEMTKDQPYGYRFVVKTETLDEKLEVAGVEERSYEAVVIEGFVYERLLAIDGRALTGEDLDAERRREKEFRKKLAEGKVGPTTGKARRGDSEERITFDDSLVSRYDMTFEQVRELDGRPCYALTFVPKPGPLPSGRRFDELLNNAAGTLCLDTETYEVAQVRFELLNKVSFWWGFLGSVSAMTGELERRPVTADVWLPQSFDLYVNGRRFLRSMHVRETFLWQDYARPESKAIRGSAK